MAVTGAASVERELALSHSAYVVFAFAGPLLVAAVLEGGLALLSDVVRRRRLVLAGQAALAAALAFVAWTKSAWGLAIGLAVAGTASGIACAASQALLVAGDPGGTERAMVRWSLFAAIGDVLTPLVTAAAIALGFSYRGAMLAVAAVVVVQCVFLARGGGEPRIVDAEPTAEPLRVAIARAVRRPRLWLWLLAAATCTLLDELVVALAALRMVRDQGTGEALAAAAAVTFSAGALAGTALTDRLVSRLGSRRVLLGSAALCAVAVAALLAPRSAIASCAALFVVGVTCAPHHPLAQARAYDEMPDNPGTVQAVGQLFVVVDVVAPIALGLVADRLGLRAALACLALQPVVVAACAALSPRRAE